MFLYSLLVCLPHFLSYVSGSTKVICVAHEAFWLHLWPVSKEEETHVWYPISGEESMIRDLTGPRGKSPMTIVLHGYRIKLFSQLFLSTKRLVKLPYFIIEAPLWNWWRLKGNSQMNKGKSTSDCGVLSHKWGTPFLNFRDYLRRQSLL